MKYFAYKILPVIFLLFIVQCQDVYEPSLEFETEKIPVIEAILADEVGASYIKIWVADKFNESKGEAIKDAHVFIKDQNDSQYLFEHHSAGKYVPVDKDFKGITGNLYALYVVTKDGYEYKTDKLVMPEKGTIENVYAMVDKKNEIRKNSYGEIFVEQFPGLSVKYHVSSDAHKKQYYLLQSETVTQRVYYVEILVPPTLYPVYVWQTNKTYETPTISSSYCVKGEQISQIIIGDFLKYFVDESTKIITKKLVATSAQLDLWIHRIQCNTIDLKTYQLYEDIIEQLKADNSIFDPIPYQLEGNIYCTSHPEAKVFGNFNVCAVSSSTYIFRWQEGWDDCRMKKIDLRELPQEDGEQENEPPEFWVSF